MHENNECQLAATLRSSEKEWSEATISFRILQKGLPPQRTAKQAFFSL
jgi:hypothetical protein